MSDDLRCRWQGSELPRAVVGRHEDGCDDEDCRGCQLCTESHCRCCGIRHSDGACGDCLAEVRGNLTAVLKMCGNLPAEVEHRGVESEALNLLGPIANPEARGHLEASVAAGRVPPEYLEAGAETPLWTLGTWSMVYRAEFEHDEPIGAVELESEAGYLDRNLTYMATWPHVPFEDFAGDLRRCVAHLEGVLHDASRGERANVACFECGGDLERKLGDKGFDDRWTCRGRGCGRRYSIAEYNFALRAKLEESA